MDFRMSIHWQFLRHAIVGFFSNLAVHFAYLLLTALGMGHNTSMNFLYVLGVLITFVGLSNMKVNRPYRCHTIA